MSIKLINLARIRSGPAVAMVTCAVTVDLDFLGAVLTKVDLEGNLGRWRIGMLTWSGRGGWCYNSCKQQEQVEQVEDPHGWAAVSLWRTFPPEVLLNFPKVWRVPVALIRTGPVMLSVVQLCLSSLLFQSNQKAHHGENPVPRSTYFLRVISMCLRNASVQGVCVSSESVIVSVSESKVTKMLLPPSPLYSLLEGGGSMKGV